MKNCLIDCSADARNSIIACAEGLLRSTARISNLLSIFGSWPPYNEKGGSSFAMERILIADGIISIPPGAF